MKDEDTLRVLGMLGILFVVYGIIVRGYYGIWYHYSYSLASFGAVLALGSLYFYRDLGEKSISIPVRVGLTAMAIVLVGMIGEIFVQVWVLKIALLSIHFYFFQAFYIAIPFLLIALLVKKYRKKAVVPPHDCLWSFNNILFLCFSGSRRNDLLPRNIDLPSDLCHLLRPLCLSLS